MTENPDIDLLTITPEEEQDMIQHMQTMDVIGDLFVERVGTPESLELTVAQLRNLADLLETINTRWQVAIEAER